MRLSKTANFSMSALIWYYTLSQYFFGGEDIFSNLPLWTERLGLWIVRGLLGNLHSNGGETSVLVLKHNFDGNAGKVKHIDRVELIIQSVLPEDLNVYVANILF